MVMTGQQCSCLRPLVWIGRKLPAQPPRPVLGVGEDATTRAAGKRPAANKRRQAIFPVSDDETEDADIF